MVKEIKPSDSRTHSKNPRWQIVFGGLTKNYLLLLVLLLFSEMILRLLLSNKDVYFLNLDPRIEEAAEPLLQTTQESVLESVNTKFEKEIEHLRNQLLQTTTSLLDLYEKFQNVERSLNDEEWLRKDELNNFLEEFWVKKRKNEGFDEVKEIIKREIDKHSADGIGRIDYAVESGGGKVVKHSEPFWIQKRSATQEMIHEEAQKILQPSFGEPGQCFSLKGSHGYVQIRLRQPIIPEAITLEHVSQSVAYDRSSAPKDCRVFGWFHNPKIDEQMVVLLAYFSYDLEKTNVQTFNVSEKGPFVHIVNRIRLEFMSNHGNPSYTCIYRLRVHGHEPSSRSAAQLQIPRDRKNDSSEVMMIMK